MTIGTIPTNAVQTDGFPAVKNSEKNRLSEVKRVFSATCNKISRFYNRTVEVCNKPIKYLENNCRPAAVAAVLLKNCLITIVQVVIKTNFVLAVPIALTGGYAPSNFQVAQSKFDGLVGLAILLAHGTMTIGAICIGVTKALLKTQDYAVKLYNPEAKSILDRICKPINTLEIILEKTLDNLYPMIKIPIKIMARLAIEIAAATVTLGLGAMFIIVPHTFFPR